MPTRVPGVALSARIWMWLGSPTWSPQSRQEREWGEVNGRCVSAVLTVDQSAETKDGGEDSA